MTGEIFVRLKACPVGWYIYIHTHDALIHQSCNYNFGIFFFLFDLLTSHPDDIDLFSGGIVEPLAYGGLVGETFNCLMSEVFVNLKYGDRFFYETKNQKHSFMEGRSFRSDDYC